MKSKIKANTFPNFFRSNAAAVIINEEGEVLAFERETQPGSWQCAQGGCDMGEDFLKCFRREFREETGIPSTALSLIAEYPSLLLYEFPRERRNDKKGRGQVQKWFLFRIAKKKTNLIDFDTYGKREFRAWKWTTMAQLIREVIPFKRNVYRKVRRQFKPYLKE